MVAQREFRWQALALAAAMLMACVSGDDFETAGGVRICDNGDIGYNSMEELNAAIEAEVAKVVPGDPARDEPYTFVLCPNRVYDVTSAPFSPMLSNVVISCGMAGIPDGPDGTCNFFGGEESVRMDTNGYHLTLMGLTFTNFNSVAITGDADSSSTVQLIRTNFEDFTASSAIIQQNAQGEVPFNVIVGGSRIREGEAGVLFSNIGGVMSLEDVDVQGGAILDSIVTTASTDSNEGATFLRRISATNSSVNELFIIEDSADVDAVGIDVRGMNYLESVVIVRGGAESSAKIDDFVVENNDLSGVDSHLWTGIKVEDMGQATFSNVTFCNNAVIDNVATTSEGSTFTINTAELCELSAASAAGGSGVVALFVNSGGGMTIEAVDLSGGITVDSILTTSGSDAGGGAVVLNGITATNSSINDLFVVDDAATVDASGINVHDMNLIETVFTVQGSGSALTIDGLVIENNDLSNLDDSTGWSGIEIRDTAAATVSNVKFCNNTVIDSIAAVYEGSNLSVENAEVCDITGRAGSDEGGGSVLFLNSGGGMALENVDLSGGVVVESIVSTTGTAAGGGAVLLSDITATDSNINNIIVVGDSASVNATGININDMNLIDTVFDVEGAGSSVTVDGLVIEENDLSDVDSHVWSGVEIRDSAEVSLSNVKFCNNAEVKNLAAVYEGATLSTETVEICGVSGGSDSDEAVGSVLFLNLGGGMTLEDIDVSEGVVVDSIVATIGPTLGGGAVIVRGITATTSNITDLFVAEEAGELDLTQVNVNNMISLDSVISVSDEESSATVENLEIVDNDATSDGSHVWSGISLNNGGHGSISNVTFCNNAHVEHFVEANSGSSVGIDSAKICQIIGGRAVTTNDISAIVFLNGQSTAEVGEMVVEDSTSLTAAFFVNDRSELDLSSSCVRSGEAQATVYVSEESTYTTTDNFVESDFSATVCPDDSGRLVQEQPDSGCFQAGRSDCEFTCTPFFRATECVFDRSEVPSSAPSISYTPSQLGSATPTASNSIQTTGSECPFRDESDVLIQDTLTTRQVIDPVLQTVAVELQLVGDACLAFAFTETCDSTLPTNEVIVAGSPSDGSVLKYRVVPFPVTDTASVIEVLPEQSQTLLTASVEQSSGVTILEFTRRLVEEGEATVPQGSTACFVYAVGAEDGSCESLSSWTRGELLIPQCATGPTIEPQISTPATTAPSTRNPTMAPSDAPTTMSPTNPGETRAPTTSRPTQSPTTLSPTRPGETPAPTTLSPTSGPTVSPSSAPTTDSPTQAPSTLSPTRPGETRPPTTSRPSGSPTTITPSQSPTTLPPTAGPTRAPSNAPSTLSPTRPGETRPPTTSRPSPGPTASPSNAPTTEAPSIAPTTLSPTRTGETRPPTTLRPSPGPTSSPTFSPTTAAPSMAPTTLSPTRFGETRPPTTPRPTPMPTKQPSIAPTGRQLEPIPPSLPILPPVPLVVPAPTVPNPMPLVGAPVRLGDPPVFPVAGTYPSSAPIALIVQGPQPLQGPSTFVLPIGQPVGVPLQPAPTPLFTYGSPAPNSERSPFHFDPSMLPPYYQPSDVTVPNPSPLADRLRNKPFAPPVNVAAPQTFVPAKACACYSSSKASKQRNKKSKGNGKGTLKGKMGKGFVPWCECQHTGSGNFHQSVPQFSSSNSQVGPMPTFPAVATYPIGNSYQPYPFQTPSIQSGGSFMSQIPISGSSTPCDCGPSSFYGGKGKGFYGTGQWANGFCNCIVQTGGKGKGKGYARHYEISQAFHRLEAGHPH